MFDASELEQLKAEIKALGITLDKQSERALDGMEDILVGWGRSRFIELSRGQTSDGTKWDGRKHVERTPRPIGILTRALLDSLQYTKPPNSRRGSHRRILRFTAPHTHLFDELRKLLPKKIPPRIARQLMDVLIESLKRLDNTP
jgi:hypothetical protein